MSDTHTLLCVHAHPDDESIFTAGATLWAKSRGIRTVLITCTDGRLGIDPEGRGGDQAGHDDEATATLRASELQLAAELAGIDQVYSLGFWDSGMAGWDGNDSSRTFVNQPVDDIAQRIAAIIDSEEVDVVITYDPNGFYGHPDHIQTHRATVRALEMASRDCALYFPVMPHHVVERARIVGAAPGVEVPAWVRDARSVAPSDVAVALPTAPFATQKQLAIRAHASQRDNAPISQLEPLAFEDIFGGEYYQRGASGRVPLPGDRDFFGGI